AMRPADVTDDVMDVTDDANIVAGSMRIVDDPDFVKNEVHEAYGQIDPTKRLDEIENYRKATVVADTDSQSENEVGQRRIKRVFSRWYPSTASAVVLRFANRTLSSRLSNLRRIEFELDRKDEGIRTGDFCDITTRLINDEFGAQK